MQEQKDRRSEPGEKEAAMRREESEVREHIFRGCFVMTPIGVIHGRPAEILQAVRA